MNRISSSCRVFKTNCVFFKQFAAFPFLAPCGRLQEICCQQNRSMQLEQLCECLRSFFLFFQNLSVITQKPSLNSKIRSEILTGDLRGIQSMFQIWDCPRSFPENCFEIFALTPVRIEKTQCDSQNRGKKAKLQYRIDKTAFSKAWRNKKVAQAEMANDLYFGRDSVSTNLSLAMVSTNLSRVMVSTNLSLVRVSTN